ncbi:YbaN family protein [Glycocaulis sp.]
MMALLIRPLWLLLGLASSGLGLAGTVLPLLPTTPFALLAVFCFSRSSENLKNWIETRPGIAPVLADWREGGAIRRSVKLMALLSMLASALIAWLAGVPVWALATQAGVMTCAAAFILSRPTRRRHSTTRSAPYAPEGRLMP